MFAAQYLPEESKLDMTRINKVRVHVGQAWRFWYDNGETFLTESDKDKAALLSLVQGWNVTIESQWVEIYTKPTIDMSEICRAIWFAAQAELAIREACKPADTTVVWQFLTGILALRDALSKPTESGRVIAMLKVKAQYPELDNWTTAGVKPTRGVGRSFDIQRMVGLK